MAPVNYVIKKSLKKHIVQWSALGSSFRRAEIKALFGSYNSLHSMKTLEYHPYVNNQVYKYFHIFITFNDQHSLCYMCMLDHTSAHV